jgi:dissimilatory sulfite reductase (desulfoviridin) alpha/beta subunit
MSSISRQKLAWVRVESGIRKRANHDGSTVYEVRVRRKGQPERTLTCPTLREARVILHAISLNSLHIISHSHLIL